ncbi:MAG: hypothetical protein NVSMB14_18370 [Isosphaeraceae bacterium]
MTAYAVAKAAGVDPGQVSRFMTGRRDVRLATVDLIAGALGFRLVEVGRRPTTKSARTSAKRTEAMELVADESAELVAVANVETPKPESEPTAT